MLRPRVRPARRRRSPGARFRAAWSALLIASWLVSLVPGRRVASCCAHYTDEEAETQRCEVTSSGLAGEQERQASNPPLSYQDVVRN